MPDTNPLSSKLQPPFRVLTLDGGGMRGLYTACLLEHLGERFAQQRSLKTLDVGKGFDLICGTSTGGIVGTEKNPRGLYY